MRAIRFYEYGGPGLLRYEQDVPEPSDAADAVLIEADAASVNPIDGKIRSGGRQKDLPPAIASHTVREPDGLRCTLRFPLTERTGWKG